MRRKCGLLAIAAVLCAGCGAGSTGVTGARTAADTATTPPVVSSPSATTPPPRAPRHKTRPAGTSPTPRHTMAPVAARRPAYRWSAAPVTAASLGDSWHSGCPVGPAGLRALSLTYWGFDRRAHQGTLIVAAAHVSTYAAAFRTIYDDRFPVRSIRPVSEFGGSDNRSMRADNTSAFNCRYAVANGPKHWSMHAYGGAVDINPLENPYRLNGKVLPPQGAPYMNRADVRPGMIVAGSVPVRAFGALGWGWGGSWSSTPDYQHFSSTGG